MGTACDMEYLSEFMLSQSVLREPVWVCVRPCDSFFHFMASALYCQGFQICSFPFIKKAHLNAIYTCFCAVLFCFLRLLIKSQANAWLCHINSSRLLHHVPGSKPESLEYFNFGSVFTSSCSVISVPCDVCTHHLASSFVFASVCVCKASPFNSFSPQTINDSRTRPWLFPFYLIITRRWCGPGSSLMLVYMVHCTRHPNNPQPSAVTLTSDLFPAGGINSTSPCLPHSTESASLMVSPPQTRNETSEVVRKPLVPGAFCLSVRQKDRSVCPTQRSCTAHLFGI